MLPQLEAYHEYIQRRSQGELTGERVRDLIYDLTGDKLKADIASAQFILESTREEK